MTVNFTQFVRDRRNQRRGLFIVYLTADKVSIGWSLCSTSRGDEFDRELGIGIAEGRIGKREDSTFSILDQDAVNHMRDRLPHSMRSTFDRVIKRCNRILAAHETAAR